MLSHTKGGAGQELHQADGIGTAQGSGKVPRFFSNQSMGQVRIDFAQLSLFVDQGTVGKGIGYLPERATVGMAVQVAACRSNCLQGQGLAEISPGFKAGNIVTMTGKRFRGLAAGSFEGADGFVELSDCGQYSGFGPGGCGNSIHFKELLWARPIPVLGNMLAPGESGPAAVMFLVGRLVEQIYARTGSGSVVVGRIMSSSLFIMLER